MFEGIVRTRLIDISTSKVEHDSTEYNSITAQGLQYLMGGRMFGDGVDETPRIHVYSHVDQITPAVRAVQGWIATTNPIGVPTVTADAAQQLMMYTVVGHLDPSGVARTIYTIGLGYDATPDTPAFAVRLSNPVTQSSSQLVEITYTLVARRTNMVSSDVEGSSAYKVSNNAWGEFFHELTEDVTTPTPVLINRIAFVDAPDDFTSGSSFAPRNGLVDNLGTRGANVVAGDTYGLTPAVTQFHDECTTLLEVEIDEATAVGVNFNKSLVQTSTGMNLYVNDMGYEQQAATIQAQNMFTHWVRGTKPYPSLDEELASTLGTVAVETAPYARMQTPALVRATYTRGGDIGDSEYTLSVRPTWGFSENDAGLERTYRLPALPGRDPLGGWTKTVSDTIAYNGVELNPMSEHAIEAFSLRMSSTPGSTYITGVDAICLPSADELMIVSNLGTTVSVINSTTTPAFTATSMNNYATIQAGGLTRMYVSCSETGLWRFNETVNPDTFAFSVPFQTAVPYVDTTACYAVASRNVTGDDLVVAVFDGIAVSTTGGTVWDVYSKSSDAGTLPITDPFNHVPAWSDVRAVIIGPDDSTALVVALILDDLIAWVEIGDTGATVFGTTPFNNIGLDLPFQAQKFSAHFPQTTPTTSQMWVFSDGSQQLRRVPYTIGVGPSAAVDAPVELRTNLIGVRMFEDADAAGTTTGMVLITTAGEGAVVLVDSEFNVIATNDHQLGRDLTSTEQLALMFASCRPYRHFYLTAWPQFSYMNPWFSSELCPHQASTNTLHHLVWRDYQYVGGEWVRIPPNLPLTAANYSLITGRATHGSDEPVFSSSPGGILEDLPPGIQIRFDPATGGFNAVAGEFTTFTLTSGVQKDAYTSLTHRASHAYYRASNLRGLTLQQMDQADFTGKPLNFITRDVEALWFSQQGVLSNAPGTDLFTRSELTAPATQAFSVAFRVTRDAPGTFALGLTTAERIGTDLASTLPVRIAFTDSTFTVFRDGQAATSALTIAQGDLFTLSVTAAGEFAVGVNGANVALSTSTTLPSALTGTLAIGAFASGNEFRYAYDMRVVTWPTASANGMMRYYKLMANGTDISADPLAVTIESRITSPPTSHLIGTTSTTYTTDPRAVLGVMGAVDEVKLLPKTAIVLVNEVPDIASVTMNALLYTK